MLVNLLAEAEGAEALDLLDDGKKVVIDLVSINSKDLQ